MKLYRVCKKYRNGYSYDELFFENKLNAEKKISKLINDEIKKYDHDYNLDKEEFGELVKNIKENERYKIIFRKNPILCYYDSKKNEYVYQVSFAGYNTYEYDIVKEKVVLSEIEMTEQLCHIFI